MPIERKQFNVRLSAREQADIRALTEDARQELGITAMSQSDLIMMGLKMVRDWLEWVRSNRAKAFAEGKVKLKPGDRED